MVSNEAVNRFDIVSELFAAFCEAVRDLLGSPHVAVHAAIFQEL